MIACGLNGIGTLKLHSTQIPTSPYPSRARHRPEQNRIWLTTPTGLLSTPFRCVGMAADLVPSPAVLSEHGLRNVALNISSAGSSTPSWTSGTADLRHQLKYPLLSAAPSSTRVHFEFCPANHLSASASFKRRCQLIALQSDHSKAGPSPQWRWSTQRDHSLVGGFSWTLAHHSTRGWGKRVLRRGVGEHGPSWRI